MVRKLRLLYLWHPEWPLAVVAMMSFAIVLVSAVASSPPHHLVKRTPIEAVISDVPLLVIATAAMMLPASLRGARHVALNVFRARRALSLVCFGLGYLLGPIILAVLLSAMIHAWHLDAQRLWLPAALLLAIVWQVTSFKKKALGRCMRTIPLRPFGWAASSSCVEFGVRHSARCLEASWPLMVIGSAVGHTNLLVMLALAFVMALEAAPFQIALESRLPVLGLLFGALVVSPILG